MKILVLAAVLAAFGAGYAAAAQSEILSPLDGAVNALFTAAGVPNRQTTRVVPIVTAGGASAGFAQIVGPRAGVAATRAVASISQTAPAGGTIEMLVPVTLVDRKSGKMHRQYGVAVDAVIHGGM